MCFFAHHKKKAASEDHGGTRQPVRTREELLALLEEARRVSMEKLSSEEALLAAIHEEGLDAVVDFQLNTDAIYTNSVRLNRRPDGTYLLQTAGERGIDRQETFRDPQEAFYNALQTVRLMKVTVEREMRG